MSKVSYFRAASVCLTAGLFVGLQFLLQGIPSVMVKQLGTAFNITLTQVGILSSSMLYLYIILQAPAGKLANRYGEKSCLIIALGCLSILCALFVLVSDYKSALIIRILMGVCSAPGVVCVMMLMNRWFSARSFMFIVGVWEAINMAIAGSGPAFMSQIVRTHGWRSVILLIAGLCVVVLIMNILIVKNAPEGYSEENNVAEEAEETEETSWRPKNKFLQLLMNPSFVCNCIFSSGLFMVVSVFASLWAIPFMRTLYPEHYVEAAESISLIFIGLAIGAPLTGAIASYINRLRIVMFWCALIALLCLSVLFYMNVSFDRAKDILFLLGISTSVYMLPFSAIRRDIPPSSLYLANAVLNASSLLAAPVFQPLVGWFLDAHKGQENILTVGSFQHALLPVYIMLCIALISLIWIREDKMYSQR